MFPRLAKARLLHTAAAFPGVLIIGARQVGKTTLARQTFPDANYCDLEDPATRAAILNLADLAVHFDTASIRAFAAATDDDRKVMISSWQESSK